MRGISVFEMERIYQNQFRIDLMFVREETFSESQKHSKHLKERQTNMNDPVLPLQLRTLCPECNDTSRSMSVLHEVFSQVAYP